MSTSKSGYIAAARISPDEYKARLPRVREAVERAGLSGLIAFGDCWRSANVSYFTEFRPLDGVSDIANAVVWLSTTEAPLLFVSDQCVDYARSTTLFEVASLRDLASRLSSTTVALRGGRVGLAGAAYIPAGLLERVRNALGSATLEPTMALAEIKAVKSDAEVALMRKAAELSDTAMEAIRLTLADGNPHTECELAHVADCAMLAGGAERTGYDSMVQAGPRSAFNLARPTDRIVAPGDLVMTDIGARFGGYVADGGRGFTYGPVSADKKAIVAAAARAVEAGLKAAKPGIRAMDLNAVIQRALVKSGFERFSSEARGHGTGHGTGMDPEEEAPWIGPTNTTVLVPNMVFTLKATITVPDVGGLRTERIVRLTEGGVEPLDKYPMELHW